MSEDNTQALIRIDAGDQNVLLWRNNSGVLKNELGRPVRFGLGNDSPALNEKLKSSDLIGITPKFVTEAMLGTIVGIFTAIETKNEAWKLTPGDDRAQAQLRYIQLVQSYGGYAGFAQSLSDFRRIIRR